MSHSITALTNHQVRLAARPEGLPKASDWQHTSEAVAEPAEGGVLVKTLMISLDPAMRGPCGVTRAARPSPCSDAPRSSCA